MWDEYLERDYQSWQDYEEQRYDSAAYAERCEELRYEAECRKLDQVIETLGIERVLNYVQTRQIQTAPPAPRPRPTTFNNVSID